MFKTSFKIFQVSILSLALLNLNFTAFAQDAQTNSGRASEQYIVAKTIEDFNAERARAGKAPIDLSNIEAATKDLSPEDRRAVYTDLDKSSVRVRRALGYTAAEIPRNQPVGVAGISEAHESFVNKLIKEKAGLTPGFERSNLNQDLRAQTSDALKRMEDARAAINEARASAGLSPLYSGEGKQPDQDEILAEKKIWEDLKTRAGNGDQVAKNQLADLKNKSDKFGNALAVVSALNQRSQAQAQTNSSGSSSAAAAAAATATATATAPAGQSATQSVQLAGADDSSDMMGSITMIAVGFIASRLYKYKMTTDIMVAAAGGAAFIVGEIMSTNKFKDVSQDLEVQARKDHNDQTQIESLNKLKKSYEEAKSAAETKKKFQLAAAAAFIGAAAVALFMTGLEITAETATVAALNTAAATASATAKTATATCSKSGAGCELIAPCTTAATSFAADVAARKSMNLSRYLNVAPSMSCQAADLTPRLAFSTQVSALVVGCPPTAPVEAAVVKEDTQQQSVNSYTPLPITYNALFFKQLKPFEFYTQTPKPSINQNYFDKLLNFFMPSAQASMMNLLMGGAGVGVGVLVGMIGTMGTSIDTFMFAPKNRGLIWGVLGGLSYGASKSTDGVIATLEGNIQKIDGMLAAMGSMAAGAAIGRVGGVYDPSTNNPNHNDIVLKHGNPNDQSNKAIPVSANPANKTSCLGSAGDSNCKSLSDQLVNLPDFQMLPSSLQGISRNAASMGDGLSGTNEISASTSGMASSLGAKLNAINKQLDKNKSNLNKLLAKAKKPGINFAKEQNQLRNGLSNSVARALKKSNMSAAGFLSSIGSGMGGSSANAAIGKNLDLENSKNKALTRTGNMYAPASGSSSLNDDNKEFADDMLSSPEEVVASAGNAEEKSEFDAYEVGENDINTDSKTSLFDLISARYVKSGYRRLFREIPEKK